MGSKPSRSSNQNKKYLLVGILLIAAIFRFGGVKPGFHQYHPDENFIYSNAVSMLINNNIKPKNYDYPAFIPLLHSLIYRLIFIPTSWVIYYSHNLASLFDKRPFLLSPEKTESVFQSEIIGSRAINPMFWSRYITASFSVGSVFLLYLLGKKLFNKNIGLIAALLLVFGFKSVVNSHISLPDAYNSFFLLLSIIVTLRLWHNQTTRNYLLAGLFVGLSTSVKYQFISALPLILIHLYLSIDKGKISIRQLFRSDFFLALAIAPLIFLVLNPYTVLNYKDFSETLRYISLKYGMGTNQLNLFPVYYLYSVNNGPAEFFAIIGGIIIALKKFPQKTLILLTAMAPHTFIFLYYSSAAHYVRNYITITPYLMIFAAFLINEFYAVIKQKTSGNLARLLLMAILITLLYLPIKNATIHLYYFTKPWNYDVFKEWAQVNLPQDTTIAAAPFDYSVNELNLKREEFNINSFYSLNEHFENNSDYVLLNLSWAKGDFYFWMKEGLVGEKIVWGKPLDVLRNFYTGLAAEEIFRYQVFSVTKPWQAPAENLILAKVPKWENVELAQVKSYSFKKTTEDWQIYGKIDTPNTSVYEFDQTAGNKSEGSLVFLPGYTPYSTIRITSPLYPVKGGHLYKISGFIKTEESLTVNEREGFIRVDFYSDQPNFEKVGLISALSARAYGNKEWVERVLVERAPNEAKYLTISFQVYNEPQYKLWLDDVVIEESQTPVQDITTKPPYKKHNIDIDLLYPLANARL